MSYRRTQKTIQRSTSRTPRGKNAKDISKSPRRQRFEDIKATFDEIISKVSEKKDVSVKAVSQVAQTNKELMELLLNGKMKDNMKIAGNALSGSAVNFGYDGRFNNSPYGSRIRQQHKQTWEARNNPRKPTEIETLSAGLGQNPYFRQASQTPDYKTNLRNKNRNQGQASKSPAKNDINRTEQRKYSRRVQEDAKNPEETRDNNEKQDKTPQTRYSRRRYNQDTTEQQGSYRNSRVLKDQEKQPVISNYQSRNIQEAYRSKSPLRNTYNEGVRDKSTSGNNKLSGSRYSALRAGNDDPNLSKVEKLERENIAVKTRLNQVLKKNNEVLKRIKQIESNAAVHEITEQKLKQKRDLELQNKGLKARIIKQDEDYDQLEQELEDLKRQNKVIRTNTDNLLNGSQVRGSRIQV